MVRLCNGTNKERKEVKRKKRQGERGSGQERQQGLTGWSKGQRQRRSLRAPFGRERRAVHQSQGTANSATELGKSPDGSAGLKAHGLGARPESRGRSTRSHMAQERPQPEGHQQADGCRLGDHSAEAPRAGMAARHANPRPVRGPGPSSIDSRRSYAPSSRQTRQLQGLLKPQHAADPRLG